MRNMGDSDHTSGESDDASTGFRPSPRQVGGAIIAVVLLVFIAVNNETTSVSLVFFTAALPLWVVLAGTALLAFGVGMLFGSRRTKAKLRSA